jgi:hypothetical protein
MSGSGDESEREKFGVRKVFFPFATVMLSEALLLIRPIWSNECIPHLRGIFRYGE